MNIHSFKFKILGILMLCTLLPLAAATQLLSFYAERNTILQAQSDIAASIDTQIENMENVLKSLEDMQQDMKEDKTIYEFANQTRIIKREKRQEYCREVFRQLKIYQDRIAAIKVTNQVHSAYVYLPGQRLLFASNQTYFEDFTLEDVDFLKQYNEQGYSMLNQWISTVPVTYETINYPNTWDRYEKLLTYCDVVRNENHRIIAIFALNLKPSFLDTYYGRLYPSHKREIIVCDRNEKIFSGDTQEHSFYKKEYEEELELPFKTAEAVIKGEEKLVISRTSHYTGWTFMFFRSKGDLLKDVNALKDIMQRIVYISGIISFGIALILSANMYRPLKKITYYMREVRHGNMSIRIHDKRRDEYEEVYSGFNRMLDELNNTMVNLETEKILNKEIKLRLLQEQINPHFLYNTLDTIFSMAKLNGENVIAKMVFSLSSFFKINLSNGKDIVKLREAVSLTDNYLVIQQIRFSERFECRKNIPEEIMDYMVPKFLLQPFVENSISHGLERCLVDDGVLYIEGKEDEGVLYFVIEDNGKGITLPELAEIQKELSDNVNDVKRHFAITAINSLIKLKYGQKYGVELYSECGNGTRVRITLPAIKE